MSEYAGRIISATEPTVTSETASGVWTLEEAAKYKQADTWPTVAEADPNFNQTVLLLHGDGTNGAQNNTFLDGSTNNFTITRNGNTTQGTFSPFSLAAGEWSNYFDRNGDYLTTPSSATLAVGSGDFTIECWIYMTSRGSFGNYIVDFRSGNTLFLSTDATDKFQYYNGSFTESASNVIKFYQWQHICVVRNGAGSNNVKGYVDGVQVLQTTDTTDYSAANVVTIGSRYTGSDFWGGYISNFRIVKSAVYTSAFTPPTAPLTNISNTSLLTCQSNRFVDNSTNAFAITRNGDVRVTPFSPFAPSAAYSASTNGGSGYFDGSGDYLSIADAAGLRFGTGNFTIQAWIYRNAAGAVHSIAAKGGASTGWVFQVHSDNKLRFTQTTTNIDSTGTIPAGTWTHVAVVREGTGTNQTKLYINGVNDGQATVTTDFNQTEQLNIGADRGNANPMNGYIAGFKYVVGTAETITVPTAPPTGGTALLNFTNAGIFDNTGKNNLETVADAQIDTTVKKYGTGSMEFDGTGDYLTFAPLIVNSLDSGDFTIEAWLYNLGYSGSQYGRGFITLYPSASYNTNRLMLRLSNTSDKINMFLVTGGTVRFDAPSGTTSTANCTTNSWVHVAFVRQSGTFKLYINGTLDTTISGVTVGLDSFDKIEVGRNQDGTVPEWNGYIDDLRITKGVARYTAAFTPPTKAFEDK